MRRQLIRLPGGRFAMGSDDHDCNPGDGEGPVRTVAVAPFAIGATTVTNAQFAGFVKRTGHVTTAERFGWSYVFAGLLGPQAMPAVRGSEANAPWWLGVTGATWRRPEGPGSHITDRQNHPVVHVSYDDAVAYCDWAGSRLPTEPEWEYAARGGLVGARYPWGDDLRPGGRYRCNIWQGRFPTHNTAADGYVGTCPVTAFPPNGYGLYNMVGNVWEWTADGWSADGPPDARAMRGGSYLCHDSYCNRYRTSARMGLTPDSSTGNVGFRVAR
jgi:formylglycine-generating enzyme required for sulfatase activity